MKIMGIYSLAMETFTRIRTFFFLHRVPIHSCDTLFLSLQCVFMSLSEFFTVFGIGIGLSMDAFAVSITQGACLDIRSLRYPLSLGITFGLFQAVMPLIGYFAGAPLGAFIGHIDHWIAWGLLGAIGAKMFYEGYVDYRRKRKAKTQGVFCPVSPGGRLRFSSLMMMGVATSIDALAVGLTFGMLGMNIWISVLVIGITTMLISIIGVYLGKISSVLLGDTMEMAGGVLLFLLGLNIALEHSISGM